MRWWYRLHESPAWLRWPAKFVLFLLTVALVCYPCVWLLPTYTARIRDMNSVLDPAHPALADLEAQVCAILEPVGPASQPARAGTEARSTETGTQAGFTTPGATGGLPASAHPPGTTDRLPANADPRRVLAAVQQVVYACIPYAWDWDVWGVMDYLPTVDEVFQKGREDCDGRAVVAASLLRRMGYDAWLVSDIQHTWVETKAGETMSPGRPEKSLIATPTGTRPALTWSTVENLLRGLAFGISVFPLTRELLILAAACLLTLHPRCSPARSGIGILAMLLSLATYHTSRVVAAHDSSVELALQVAGALLALTGWLLAAVKRPWQVHSARIGARPDE